MQPTQNSDDRNVQVPPRANAGVGSAPARDAAAQIMRDQINQIYDSGGEPNISTGSTSPYKQHHSENADHKAAGTPHWQQYHTAWQSYYQQYYERYYLSQLHKRNEQVQRTSTAPGATTDEKLSAKAEVTPDQAVNELRSKLMTKVRERSTTVRKSRHFMPIVAAVLVALVFVFLQYNSLIFAQVKAYVSPGSIDPQNIILDPTTDVKVGPDPLLLIPKINVQAPVIYGVSSADTNAVEANLHNGVVNYPIPGASSVPGQIGNTVVLGHSSNDVFDNGNYKFIFVQLDKLNVGDTFYLNYQGTRYTYSVTEKKIINPDQVNQLVINNGKPLATLVTCTPPGTALQRLIVIGEQISPDPSKATQGTATNQQPASIPGNSPSILERLFSGAN